MEDQEFEPVELGTSEHLEKGLEIRRLPSGRAVLVPLALRRLKGEQYEVVSDIQHAAVAVHEAQASLSDLVGEARDLGVSWNAIGWSVGTSAQAARKRWGD